MSDTSIPAPRIRAPWLQSAALRKVFAAITSGDKQARVVGGAVRNTLAGRMVNEIDLATDATPDVVIRLSARAGLAVHPTGISHGTVTIVADGHPFEVTTLRRDVKADGRRAVVAFTTDWAEDAARRDFTINAIYCAQDGTIYDPAGGIDDLKARRVRFIGSAEQRIREDYLRILRFFRFSADFGAGPLDPEGLAASAALKDGLDTLSAERVWAELKKLLVTPRAAEIIRIMNDHGMLQPLVRAPVRPDVLARLQAIEAFLGVEPDAIARLTALAGSDESLAKKLRLSRVEAADLAAAGTDNAAFNPATPEQNARVALYELGKTAYARAQRVAWARSQSSTADADWQRRNVLAARWQPPKIPFTGADVIALGIPPGPRVGAVLARFERWWKSSDFPTDADQLRQQLAEIAAKG